MTNFEKIMVVVMSIMMILVSVTCTVTPGYMTEAKAEVETYDPVDLAIETINEFNDELIEFLMSDEYQEWCNAYEESY